nr:putative reverse transcriptase domain-containing protein [Tanacetum cinerariifolium]
KRTAVSGRLNQLHLFWWRGRGGEMMGVAVVVVAAVEWGRRGVAARGGEWCGGSYRSGEGEYYWGSPEKFSGGGGGGRRLHFIEEPVEIMDREVKRLKQSRIPIVKVRWNSRRGLEFTWEREDQMQRKKFSRFYLRIVAGSEPGHLTL